MRLICTITGGNFTWLRFRAYHANHSIANHTATVRNHRAKFGVELSKHRTGTYRFVVSMNAGGKVRHLNWSVRVRR